MSLSPTLNILLIDVPNSLRDSLEVVIEDQDNMELVGEAFDPIDIVVTLNEIEADVVIMGHPHADRVLGIFTHLLAENPYLLILTISTIDQRAFLYQTKIIQEEVSYTVPEDLIARINEAYSAIQ